MGWEVGREGLENGGCCIRGGGGGGLTGALKKLGCNGAGMEWPAVVGANVRISRGPKISGGGGGGGGGVLH